MSVLSAVGYFVLWWGVFSKSPIDLTTEVIAHFILSSCQNHPVYGNRFTVSVLTNDLHLVQRCVYQFTAIVKLEVKKFTRVV